MNLSPIPLKDQLNFKVRHHVVHPNASTIVFCEFAKNTKLNHRPVGHTQDPLKFVQNLF